MPLSPLYNTFRRKLEDSLPLFDGPAPSTAVDPKVKAALEVLWAEAKANDCDKKGNRDKKLPTGQGTGVVHDAGQPRALVDQVDNALVVLVRTAIEEFGSIPRDAYRGVFNLPLARVIYDRLTRGITYKGLKKLAGRFIATHELGSSVDHLLVMYPSDTPTLDRDGWELDFKSVRIARAAAEEMRLKDDGHLWETYDFLRRHPETAALARRISGMIDHPALGSGPAPQTIVLSGGDPPTSFTPMDPVPPPRSTHATRRSKREHRNRQSLGESLLHPLPGRQSYPLHFP